MSLDRFQIFCPNKHSDVQLGQHTDRTFQVQIQVKMAMMRMTRKVTYICINLEYTATIMPNKQQETGDANMGFELEQIRKYK